jgi:hypothetical protein
MSIIRHLIAVAFALVLLASCKKTEETTPIRSNITETVFASGELIPGNQYNLTAETEGYLVEVNFEAGDTVSERFVIGKIEHPQSAINVSSSAELLKIARKNTRPDAPALQQALQNIKNAREKLEQDSLMTHRYKRLYDSRSVARIDYENVEAAYQTSKNNLKAQIQAYNNLERQAQEELIADRTQYEINSSLRKEASIQVVVSGKVYQKLKQRGDYVKKGDVIAVIGKPEGIYANLSVDETSIAKVKTGQQTYIQLNSNLEKVYKGYVSGILPQFDVNTQSYYCEAKFSDPLDFKISGTQLQANIVVGKRENALVIPRAYLGYGNKVIVKGAKEPVIVKTGFISNDWVEILGGINDKTVIEKEK